MSRTDGKNLRVVLHELEKEDRFQAISSLLENGFEVTVGREVDPAEASTILVLGKSDLNGKSALDIAREVREETGARKLEEWKPWFPVIDYDRCTNCMQCLSFCLFGVYGADGEGKIEVRNQDQCKTDCPACSRVCPEVAILFPKYRHGPINGDTVTAEDIDREKMKVDVSALLGGDIYKLLRDRSAKAKSRFSKERDDERALKERMRCLKKLGTDLDVPADVLMNLPSAEEIQRRAEAAKQAAEAALAVADAGPTNPKSKIQNPK